MNKITKNRHDMLLNLEDVIYNFKRAKYAYISKAKCLCKKAEKLDNIYKIKGTLHKIYDTAFIKHIFSKAIVPINHKQINIGDPQNAKYCYCHTKNNKPKKIIIWKGNHIMVNNRYYEISEILGHYSEEYNIKINYDIINILYINKIFTLYNYDGVYGNPLKITRDAKSAMSGVRFANVFNYDDNDLLFLNKFPNENNLKLLSEVSIYEIKKMNLHKFKLLESIYIHTCSMYCDDREATSQLQIYNENIKYLIDNLPNLKYLRIYFGNTMVLFENKRDFQYFLSNCNENFY